ncbi:argonaut-like protein [Reticulomyxa filosa]|uniref:Argonaut-like protein n=1 Tax=Reticulomyxa filosa TaxID=46433 RepID=X6NWT0_RETFI|nr:argonaut-like protein [Reticulomyxa filosa]|eukprot:ETO30333.1 argonaut-like protein [Reticulomyxa filosa]
MRSESSTAIEVDKEDTRVSRESSATHQEAEHEHKESLQRFWEEANKEPKGKEPALEDKASGQAKDRHKKHENESSDDDSIENLLKKSDTLKDVQIDQPEKEIPQPEPQPQPERESEPQQQAQPQQPEPQPEPQPQPQPQKMEELPETSPYVGEAIALPASVRMETSIASEEVSQAAGDLNRPLGNQNKEIGGSMGPAEGLPALQLQNLPKEEIQDRPFLNNDVGNNNNSNDDDDDDDDNNKDNGNENNGDNDSDNKHDSNAAHANNLQVSNENEDSSNKKTPLSLHNDRSKSAGGNASNLLQVPSSLSLNINASSKNAAIDPSQYITFGENSTQFLVQAQVLMCTSITMFWLFGFLLVYYYLNNSLLALQVGLQIFMWYHLVLNPMYWNNLWRKGKDEIHAPPISGTFFFFFGKGKKKRVNNGNNNITIINNNTNNNNNNRPTINTA